MQTFAYSSHLFTEAVDHKWQPYAAWCANITELLLRHNKPRKMEIMLTRNEVQNQSKDPLLLIVPHSLTDWMSIIYIHELCFLADKHLRAEALFAGCISEILSSQIHVMYMQFIYV